MTKTKRTFTAEFKLESAKLVVEEGYTVAQACESMGVSESAMRKWVRQLETERSGKTPTSKALTPEQQKIQELEARVKRLELEKTILKKATALLMSDEMRHTH